MPLLLFYYMEEYNMSNLIHHIGDAKIHQKELQYLGTIQVSRDHKQHFYGDGDLDNVSVVNDYSHDAIEKENYEMRKGNDNGWTGDKSLRHFADIPKDVFMLDPLMIEYRAALARDKGEAAKIMRQFLFLHPEYRVNNGGI